MLFKESQTADLRDFGDGKSIGESEQEQAILRDPGISWDEKRLRIAWSNGCFQPEHVLAEVAEKHPELTSPEDIARQDAMEYAIQNNVFGMMKKWAEEKDDKSLLIDMTETPYPRPESLEFEAEHVPESFAQEDGVATGMARDPAFFIAERVARILIDYKYSWSSRRTRFLNALGTLQEQIAVSNSLDELHANFFKSINSRRNIQQTQ